jgi:hypothetical protein
MAPFRFPTGSSETLARELGLRRSGRRYIGGCPVCGYTDSFVVCDGADHPLAARRTHMRFATLARIPTQSFPRFAAVVFGSMGPIPISRPRCSRRRAGCHTPA